MEGDNESTPTAPVTHVAVKVPPFWPNDVELWFLQLEGQFHLAKVVDETTRFYHVVGNLPPEYLREVRKQIKEPRDGTPYTDLKRELIARTGSSLKERLGKLVDQEELGDRKPTQFLRALQQHIGDEQISPELTREFFLRRMPPMVCAVVATLPPTTDIEQVAATADAILEAAPSSRIQSVSTAASATTTITENERLDKLEQQVAQLTNEVRKLSTSLRSRRESRSRSRGRSQSYTRTENGQCYYHFTYGKKAKKCKEPCSFTKN